MGEDRPRRPAAAVRRRARRPGRPGAARTDRSRASSTCRVSRATCRRSATTPSRESTPPTTARRSTTPRSRRSCPTQPAKVRDELTKLGTVPADVWINDDDRVVKMQFAIDGERVRRRGRQDRDDDGDHRLRPARRRAGPAGRRDRRSVLARRLSRSEPGRYRGPSWTRCSRRSGGVCSTSSTGRPRRGQRRDPKAGKRIVDAVQSLVDDGHQALVFAVLGHKADLGVMALGPDLARLQAFQHELAGTPLTLVDSYVSLTELSEYTSTEDDERARLASEERLEGAAAEARLAAWRDRMAHYHEQRIHPQLPLKQTICFYPMSKRRTGDANWYSLPVRGAEAADGRPRARRAHLRRARAPADHRLHRARRLGVGRHAARRRPRRAQGDRLRDAVRPRVGRLRRVRSVRHRVCCSSRPRRCGASGSERIGRGPPCPSTFACSCRSPRSSSTGR